MVEIDSVKLAIGVGVLVFLVPARDSNHFASQPLVKFDGVLGHVAETLDAGGGVFGANAQLFKSFPQGEDHTVACRLGAAKRSPHSDGFASDKSGITSAMDLFELVEYPQHVLRVGHDIGCRHIGERSHVPCYLAHPTPADLLLLTQTQVVGIAYDTALGPSQRDIHDRALAGAARIVVLDAETAENLHRAVVHSHGDGKVELP